MKFSERLGYKTVREKLQYEEIDLDLKNSLWSVFLESFFNNLSEYGSNSDLYNYHRSLWLDLFKHPIDTAFISEGQHVFKDELKTFLRTFFFKGKNWYDPYDLIEFSARFATPNFVKDVNQVLQREKSAYRFVNRIITPITSETEISAIEDVVTSKDIYQSVSTHLNAALMHLTNKKNPDYRNSIKESISGVESMCKIFTKDEKATLGATLTQLGKDEKIHPAMKNAFSALYGYSSDDAGIRHALMEGDRKVDFHEAKFMLVTCSAFINFLKSKQE